MVRRGAGAGLRGGPDTSFTYRWNPPDDLQMATSFTVRIAAVDDVGNPGLDQMLDAFVVDPDQPFLAVDKLRFERVVQ